VEGEFEICKLKNENPEKNDIPCWLIFYGEEFLMEK